MKQANSEIDGKRKVVRGIEVDKFRMDGKREVVGGTAIDKFRACNERGKFRDRWKEGGCRRNSY